MINIICKGIYPIPNEAKTCPVCGEYAQRYYLDKMQHTNSVYNQCQHEVDDYIQRYPTFTCARCQTIWQYLGEKVLTEEEMNKLTEELISIKNTEKGEKE